MSELEVQILVSDAAEHQVDVEQVLAAIGAYQANKEHPFHLMQTAGVGEKGGDVELNLVRTLRHEKSPIELHQEVKAMKQGIEEHFPKTSRERLSQLSVKLFVDGVLVPKE